MKLKYIIIQFIISIPILFNGIASGETIRIAETNKQKYISVYEITNKFEIQNSFDIITGRGKFFYKGSLAVYQTDLSVMIINNKLIKSHYPIVRNYGEILLPLQFCEKLLDDFFPDFTYYEKENIIHITTKINKTPEKKTLPSSKGKDTSIASSSDKITFIIIDAGHGGKDPGAIGKGRIQEKGITLKIANYLNDYLKPRLKNINIQLTRKSDKFIDLSKRTEIANKLLKKDNNGLFISVHVNASILHSVAGFETYFLSQNPSNEEARATAALENNVIVLEENSKHRSYNDVEHVEAIMLTTQIQKESATLANFIQKYFGKKIPDAASKGVKKADFFVLRDALMPAVLVEVGYISNQKECRKLVQSSYQKKIAEGIGNGIIYFINDYNKTLKNR